MILNIPGTAPGPETNGAGGLSYMGNGFKSCITCPVPGCSLSVFQSRLVCPSLCKLNVSSDDKKLCCLFSLQLRAAAEGSIPADQRGCPSPPGVLEPVLKEVIPH